MSGEIAEKNYQLKPDALRRTQPGRKFSLTSRHSVALAGMAVLSAMRLASVGDWVFVVFSFAYTSFLSKIAFPTISPPPNFRVYGERKRAFDLYVLLSGVISFVFPVPYILESFLRGDKEGIRSAASHVFLLAAQILTEGLTFYSGFSLPVFVFVPVFYNSRRIFTIMDWLKCEMSEVGTRRTYIGRVIASANLAFWCFNLFGFLLPVFLPKAFKAYYSVQRTSD